jgi:hypothetical protein
MADISRLPTLHYLRTTFTPTEYQDVIAYVRKYDRYLTYLDDRVAQTYYERLPNYLIARCPLCSASHTARLDTHSLQRWFIDANKYNGVFGPIDPEKLLIWNYEPDQRAMQFNNIFNVRKYQDVGCRHFFAVQTFINFHGTIPTEVEHFTNQVGDVPYVMPMWLPDEMASVAVMHSLPICRIEHNAFVPRYALYLITYYADDGPTVLDRRVAEERLNASEDREYDPLILYPTGSAAYDLRSWVDRGKLCWLDPTMPELTLQTKPSAAFPYAEIAGFKRKFEYVRTPQRNHRAQWNVVLWEGEEGLIYSPP